MTIKDIWKYHFRLNHFSLLAQHWTERSACDQRSNLERPPFLVINLNLFLLTLLATVTKLPEGVVVGFLLRIPIHQKFGNPLPPHNRALLAGQKGYFQKSS